MISFNAGRTNRLSSNSVNLQPSSCKVYRQHHFCLPCISCTSDRLVLQVTRDYKLLVVGSGGENFRCIWAPSFPNVLPGVEKADLAATFMVGDRVDDHLEGRSPFFCLAQNPESNL